MDVPSVQQKNVRSAQAGQTPSANFLSKNKQARKAGGINRNAKAQTIGLVNPKATGYL
jgi:hypothetical protein